MSIKTKIKHLIQPKKTIYSPVYVVDESEILKGKNIVITGGSSGIGRSIAVLACNYEANVVIVGRNESGLIESCKKRGTLAFKKDTEDLIEEVLEWTPTIVVIEKQEESTKEKPNKK